MENNNKLMDFKDDDLKFMPLKVDNPFSGSESNWFPLVNLDSPNINNFINNFIFGFSTPMVPGKIDDNFYKNIEYFNDNQSHMNTKENESNTGYNQTNIGYPQGNTEANMGYNQGNIGYNPQGNPEANMGYNQGNVGYNPQGKTEANMGYNQPNLGYNSQGNMEGNMGYNQQGYNQESTGCNKKVNNNITQNCNNLGMNYQQYPKEAYGQELISYEKGYIKGFNNNFNATGEREGSIEDLPHMKVLKEYSFLELAEEELRGGNKEKVNNILSKIENGDDSILKIFRLYDIPDPIASIVIKKIINDALYYN